MKRRAVTSSRRKANLAEVEADLDAARPYLELAREIQVEVARIAADPSAEGELLAQLIDRIPSDERMKFARTIFDRLSAEDQWAVIERVYDDEEIRGYLAAERAARLADARRDGQRREFCQTARERRELDTRDIAPGEEVTLGLFREEDVRAAVVRGQTSSTCARQLVLRAGGGATFQVLVDQFNPRGGYFVTAEYSEDTWRDHERFGGHAALRVGSLSGSDGGASFEPVIYPGGRVDFEIDGRPVRGRLHLGFAMLGDLDVFVP